MNFPKDSTIVPIGISWNFFPFSLNPFCLEYKPNKSPNNIFGIGTGYTIYYIRQFPKLQKNIIAGIPIFLSQRNLGQTNINSSDILSNYITISPIIGLQFEIGKKKFLRLRATYSPIIFDWKRNQNKTIIERQFYNYCGFGFTFHY